MDLIAQLEKRGNEFDFFQAVRLLENHLKNKGGTLRFDSIPALEFSVTPIYQIRKNFENWKITSGFFGLYGPHGALPDYFVEIVRKKTTTGFPLKDFLDIFGNRLIFLFYTSWKKNRYSFSFKENKLNYIELFCLSLMGLRGVSPPFFLKNAGLLSFARGFQLGIPTASYLKKILMHYYKIKVKIIESPQQWTMLPPDQCTYLSQSKNDLNCLGKNAIVGKRISCSSHYFKIIFGPLTYCEYQKFLDKEIQKNLHSIIQYYLQFSYHYEIQLTIKTKEIPVFYLGKIYLGKNTWFCSKTQTEMRGAVVTR